MRLRTCRLGLGAVVLIAGCGSPNADVQTGDAKAINVRPSRYVIQQCKLDVNLDPAAHRLDAVATLEVAVRAKPDRAAPAKLQLQLNPDLTIDSVTCDGKAVAFRRLADAQYPTTAPANSVGFKPYTLTRGMYELDWQTPAGRPGVLVIHYGGAFSLDLEAAKKEGELYRRLTTDGYVGMEGVCLGDRSVWYPQIVEFGSDDSPVEYPLASFEVTANELPGMVLVCCGNRDGAKLNGPRGERTTWRTPFPLASVNLVGGPYEVSQRQVGDVLISVHSIPSRASFAPRLLDAAEAAFHMYISLFGPFPFTEFTIIDAYSWEYASYAGFTCIDSRTFPGKKPDDPSEYVAHELVHDWWGNGVLLSSLDGDWSEGLATYCAEHLRPVLEGHPEKARTWRRDSCYCLSRLHPSFDEPVSTFGRGEWSKSAIGYEKGAIVFAMLADQIGQDTMWHALRRLREERLGKPTTWKDIQAIMERESKQDLSKFFATWVEGRGIPDVSLDEASYDPQAKRIALTLLQKGDRVFDISVPIRLLFDDAAVDRNVAVNRATQVVLIPSLRAPKFIELDPDFRILRRVAAEDILPSISEISSSKGLLIVHADGDGNAYEPLAKRLKMRYDHAQDTAVREIKVGELKPEDFKQGHLLLLGEACRAPLVEDVLRGCPLSFLAGGFRVGDKFFDKPANEVLCFVRNQHDPGAIICLYYGNSPNDVKMADSAVFFSDNSLVVFEDGKVVLRQDFERTDRIEVKNPG